MKATLAFLTCILVGLALSIHKLQEGRFDSVISYQIKEALKQSPGSDNAIVSEDSFIRVLAKDKDSYLSEKQIQGFLMDVEKKNRAGVRYWSQKDQEVVSASAYGTDGKHHFVNGYLVGYEPFEAEQLWVPHYAVSMRLKYEPDSKQYGGLLDVWQSSKQAFFNTRGDCEDHSLVIADWLIAMGEDARVVLGKLKMRGHAWVVVFKDDKVFLLEATNKLKRKLWRHYPLAGLVANYHPEYMFNREYFWVNTGSTLTTDYKGQHWVKRSRYFLSEKDTSFLF